ncbi:hypothetical protein OC842_003527 [Tilletia horrida]|uniref:[Histone H3]-trimethyl-L-lysine(9) demethylase n=1 Tax=Tilletia horrida TaxID=155126 RepID=A0AAN6GFY2_9BASI|nr:hypothetical protein OC842_003527 [Tilletia horrida]
MATAAAAPPPPARSAVSASDSDSELSDIEDILPATMPTASSQASASAADTEDDSDMSDLDSDDLSEEDRRSAAMEEDVDEDDDASSLSELSSSGDEDGEDRSTSAAHTSMPTVPARTRPAKRKADDLDESTAASTLDSRRSLRRHGLPPDTAPASMEKQRKQERQRNAPTDGTADLGTRRTRSGATSSSSGSKTRRAVSTPEQPLSRTRSGRQVPAPSTPTASPNAKPIRQRPSGTHVVEVSIGPSPVRTSDFSPGGNPDDYATKPSPAKRRRTLSASGDGAGDAAAANGKKKKRKVKNRGWGRSGSAKTPKSEGAGSSGPRTSRKRLHRPDPALDYLTEVFSLNEKEGEEFHFNGDALSVPFPFTFNRASGAAADQDAEQEGGANAGDTSSDIIEMPLEGPLSVVEASHKAPLQIPSSWIPPLPPRAVRHLERQAKQERRQQALLAAAAAVKAEQAALETAQQAGAVSTEVASAEDVKMAELASSAETGQGAEHAPALPVPTAPQSMNSALSILSEQAVLQQTPAQSKPAPLQPGPTAVAPSPIEPAPASTKESQPVLSAETPAPAVTEMEAEGDESDSESDDGLSPLRPSSFYPTPGGSGGFPGIPIFTPTMSQFKDFYSLCKRIDAWGMRTGIVKIIPPKEWTESLPDLNTEVEQSGGPIPEAIKSVLEQRAAAEAQPAGTDKEAQDHRAPTEAATEPSDPIKKESGEDEQASTSEAKPAELPAATTAVAPPSVPVPPLRTVRIRNAIRQVILPVGSGAYSQTNLTTPNKVWNAKQWADICASEAQRGPELDRMKRKIESLKAGADALNVHGLSGYRRKRKDAAAAEDLDEMLKETEGVRTRSGRKHRTARDEEADDEDEDGAEDEHDAEDEAAAVAAERSDELQVRKQPAATSASSTSAPLVHSPPQSEHGADKGVNGHPAEEHVLTPPASHANDGSDRSDHHVGSPTATAVKEDGRPSAGDASMDVDPEMPALEDMSTMSQNASPTKAPKKVSMPDRTTPAEWRAFNYKTCWLKEAVDADEEADEDAGHKNASTSTSEKTLPKASEWTIDVCKEIEGEYWRNLSMGKPAMYGADLPGTLFEPDMDCWNVGKLDNLLTRMRFRRKLRGVTTPYLYFGMWRATFAWHLEDMDLYSINYIHFGAPKQWYAIPQTERKRFETAMASAFPTDARKCPHFMRHKSYLVSPRYLARHNIKPLKLVQHAGEFVITYPYGYHSGYNLGFNCAESVNFALDTWVEIGRNAGFCKCRSDSVQMDVEAFLEEALQEEKARAEKEREDAEKKERARLKKLQGSSKGKAKAEDGGAEGKAAKAARKSGAKREAEAGAGGPEGAAEGAEDGGAAGKKAAKPKGFPCVFCVSMIEDDMVPIPPSTSSTSPKLEQGTDAEAITDTSVAGPSIEPGSASADATTAAAAASVAKARPQPPAAPVRYAHRLCANILPETWVHRDVEIVKVRRRKKARRSGGAIDAGASALAAGTPAQPSPFAPPGYQTAAAAIVPSSDDEDSTPLGSAPGAKTGSGGGSMHPPVPSSDSGDDEAPILVDEHAHDGPARYGSSPVEWEEVEEEVVKEEEVRGFENIERARWALKCSLCPTNQLAKQGCKVQCTRGKCSRAAHVTCANLADSGWYVAILSKAEADKLEFGGMRSKKGSKKGKAKAGAGAAQTTKDVHMADAGAGAAPVHAGAGAAVGADTSTAVSASGDVTMEIDAPGGEVDADGDADGDGDDAGEKPHDPCSDADERLVLLCKAHNPEAKKAEAIRKALLLREQCLALRPMSLINVRAGSNSGVWQVLLLEVYDVPGGEAAVRSGSAAPTTKGEVMVMYDGQKHRVKWGRIEFGTTGKAVAPASTSVPAPAPSGLALAAGVGSVVAGPSGSTSSSAVPAASTLGANPGPSRMAPAQTVAAAAGAPSAPAAGLTHQASTGVPPPQVGASATYPAAGVQLVQGYGHAWSHTPAPPPAAAAATTAAATMQPYTAAPAPPLPTATSGGGVYGHGHGHGYGGSYGDGFRPTHPHLQAQQAHPARDQPFAAQSAPAPGHGYPHVAPSYGHHGHSGMRPPAHPGRPHPASASASASAPSSSSVWSPPAQASGVGYGAQPAPAPAPAPAPSPYYSASYPPSHSLAHPHGHFPSQAAGRHGPGSYAPPHGLHGGSSAQGWTSGSTPAPAPAPGVAAAAAAAQHYAPDSTGGAGSGGVGGPAAYPAPPRHA